ncbi:unnamed protein product [Dicrocoelium dendriticum]|nr:unnamed protein product [Dicrocoelium dendriticum]
MQSVVEAKSNRLSEERHRSRNDGNTINCVCLCQQIAQLSSVNETVHQLASSQQSIMYDLIKLHNLMTEQGHKEKRNENLSDRKVLRDLEGDGGLLFSDFPQTDSSEEQQIQQTYICTTNRGSQTEEKHNTLAVSRSQVCHRSTQTPAAEVQRTPAYRSSEPSLPRVDVSANRSKPAVYNDLSSVEATAQLCQTDSTPRITVEPKSSTRVEVSNGEIKIKLEAGPVQESLPPKTNCMKKSQKINYEFGTEFVPQFLDFRNHAGCPANRNIRRMSDTQQQSLNFYIWTVENFTAAYQAESEVCSEPFYLGQPGYRMCTKLEFTNRFMGIYVQLVCGQFDSSLKWPFREDIQFILVDQTARGRNLARTLKPYPDDEDEHGIWDRPWETQTSSAENTAWGVPDFVPRSMLLDDSGRATDYVRNNKIYIAIRLL